MIRRGPRNSLEIEMSYPLEGISPWNTTPRAEVEAPHLTAPSLKPLSLKKRLSLSSISNTYMIRSKSSKIEGKETKALPVVDIDFKIKQTVSMENSRTLTIEKPKSKPKPLRETDSNLNIKRDLMVLRRVFNMNKRYSLKPI